MTGKIEQGIGLSDAQALRTIADFHNLVAGCDFAGFQYAEVEAGSVMLDQQGGHARLVHADSNPVAGHPGLRHFEQGAARRPRTTSFHTAVYTLLPFHSILRGRPTFTESSWAI